MQQNLEADVGIGRLMPCFQGKITTLSALFQYNPAQFGLTRLNPLTEEFTESFCLSRKHITLKNTANSDSRISL
jgi:hypothetical protein